MKRCSLFSLISLFLFSTGLSAQKEINVGTNLLVDDNIFRTSSNKGDVVTIPYADLGYQLNPGITDESLDMLYFGYSGQFYLFNKMSQRDFSVHSFNTHYNYLWPETRNLIALGGKVETRINPKEYNYYDYNSGGFYLNYKRYLKTNLMLLAGYNLVNKNFAEFPEFNYLENTLSVQTSLFLKSRTTLRFTANYYHKNYTNSIASLDSVYIEPVDGNAPVMGMGRGMMRRPGIGIPTEDGEGFYWYRMQADEFPSTDQFKLGLSVAQNLAEGIGVTASYTARLNPHNRNRYLTNLGESVLNNEELFDDHYSYVGHQGRFQYKQMLPAESILTLIITARSRNFRGRPALDLVGNALPSGENRRDKALLFEVEFSKKLSTGLFDKSHDLDLSVGFGLGRNSSNDEYYDYSDKFFLLSLKKDF
jgi:hypothetical protein